MSDLLTVPAWDSVSVDTTAIDSDLLMDSP